MMRWTRRRIGLVVFGGAVLATAFPGTRAESVRSALGAMDDVDDGRVVVLESFSGKPPSVAHLDSEIDPLSATIGEVTFLPDLAVVNCASSCDPITGLLDITLDVCNVGVVTAGAFEVGVYASLDSTITTSDQRIGVGTADILAAGACITFVGPLDISSLAAGTYTIGAIADDLLQVIEIDETNNTCANAPAALPCCDGAQLRATPTSLTVDCHGAALAAPTTEVIRFNSTTLHTAPMTATAMASSAPRGWARRILHFTRRPGVSEKRALEAMGVRPLAYLPGNAVIATVPPGFVPPEEVNVDWIGVIEPRWKLARALRVAGQPGEVHGVVVEFFADAPPGQARAILAAHNVQVLRNDHLPAHAFAVRADIGRIEALAGDDAVASIVLASQAILQNQPTHWCAGPSTIFGPVASFVVINDGWDGPGQGSALDLTYHFNNFTADMPGSSAITEIVRAMDAWAEHAAVAFTQASGPDQSRSIDILFGIGDHGDPFPFDGFGGVLAHTFLPIPDNVEPIAGDMHFDDAEFWQIGADIDLFTVALHELGHALGLGHSDDPTAVMYAFYGGPVSGLASDDIAGIQSIYAAASASGGDCLTLFNDGCSPLVISSIAAPTWAVLVPAPPFTISPGGSQQVCIDACGACAGSDLVDTLIISSDDPVTPIVNVPLTVDCNDPPIADAGPDQTITDADGDGGETITLNGTASSDSDGTIVNYTWSEDSAVLIDTATPTTSIDLPVGVHTITLRVTDNDGTTATDTVAITIEGTCTSAATRILPGAYSPGLATMVQITVTPEVGTLNWAVQETPPAGWTVSAISDFGTFVGGTVKWGPFTGSTPVTLSYDVTPPALESTSGCFAGVISVDGATRSVCGDDCVSACPCHPADSNCDYSITIDEATAYGACWLSGCVWPVAPSPPNIDFVTRAGFLWQSGELYCCDVNQPPPTLWVSAVPSCPTNSAVMGAAAEVVTSLGSAEREFHLVRDGNDFTLLVQIVVTPDVNASTFAIEETVSGDATIGAISADGRFDVTTGRFRWGPFSDGLPRVLSYEIRGEQLDAVMSSAAGRLSVDGVSLPITDRGLIVPNPGDFDADDDLDLSDFLGFIECFERDLEPVPLVCRLFDFDADGDVDLTDLLTFQATFTGAR